ncbi:MAG: hypothetical protein QOD39_3930 [Mycobacterium sp.]|nr:hypothetical protein [Mycobacterium sp.]
MTTGDFDPQTAPDSETGGYPPPPPAGQEPGSLGLRLGARIIDNIVVYIVAIAIGFVLSTVTDYANNPFLFAFINGLIAGVLTFIYFIAFETSQGWTLGKKVLGLSVHGPDGATKPTFQQSAIRNVWTLFNVVPPQIVGGVLYLIAVIGIGVTINGSPTKQGIHDRLAGGTQVVKG